MIVNAIEDFIVSDIMLLCDVMHHVIVRGEQPIVVCE